MCCLSKVMCYLTWLWYQNRHKVPIGRVCCCFIYFIICLGFLCGYACFCVYVGMHIEARVQHWCLIESLSMLRQGLSQDLELTNSAILSGMQAAGILLPLPPQHWESTSFLHRLELQDSCSKPFIYWDIAAAPDGLLWWKPKTGPWKGRCILGCRKVGHDLELFILVWVYEFNDLWV